MEAIAKVNRIDAGNWEVIDVRLNRVVKRNLKTGAKAAGYVSYYTEEVKKAENQWEEGADV